MCCIYFAHIAAMNVSSTLSTSWIFYFFVILTTRWTNHKLTFPAQIAANQVPCTPFFFRLPQVPAPQVAIFSGVMRLFTSVDLEPMDEISSKCSHIHPQSSNNISKFASFMTITFTTIAQLTPVVLLHFEPKKAENGHFRVGIFEWK